MATPSVGANVWSVEFGWGSVDSIFPNGDFGVRYLSKDFSYNDAPSFIERYNPNWERVTKIKTKQTLFTFPHELLPVTIGSII